MLLLLSCLFLAINIDDIQDWDSKDLKIMYKSLNVDQKLVLNKLIKAHDLDTQEAKAIIEPKKKKVIDEGLPKPLDKLPSKHAENENNKDNQLPSRPEAPKNDAEFHVAKPPVVAPKQDSDFPIAKKPVENPPASADEELVEVVDPSNNDLQTSTPFSLKYVWISLVTVFVSEIGDKTFFIVAILGMKHSKILIVMANLLAMSCMTFISASLGHLVPNIIQSQWVAIIAGLVLILFGLSMLKDRKNNKIKEEYEEAKEELAEDNLDTGESKIHSIPAVNLFQKLGISPIFIKSFTMIFLAEWGDVSQLSTIALGASGGLFPVIVGSILGHALCTVLAIAFGHLLAQRLSATQGIFIIIKCRHLVEYRLFFLDFLQFMNRIFEKLIINKY